MAIVTKIKSKLLTPQKVYFYLPWLLGYHLLFAVANYWLRVSGGKSDAQTYWGISQNFRVESMAYFLQPGTAFLQGLHYPLVYSGAPFWFGFLVHAGISFAGFVFFTRWLQKIMPNPPFLIFLLLILVVYSPNLHLWTANLGKESLLFTAFMALLYATVYPKNRFFLFFVGMFFIVALRPHWGFMALAALVPVLLFYYRKQPLRNKMLGLFFGVALLGGLFYMMLQMSEIRVLNWEKIRYYNAYSVLSFRDTKAYVPMLDYPYAYKYFSFYFRPQFYDAKVYYYWPAIIENNIVLILHGVGLGCLLRHFRKIQFSPWMWWMLGFAVINIVIYAERYANFGIFMRTKVVIFSLSSILCIEIIRQRLYLPKK